MKVVESGKWGSYDANVYYNPEKCGLKIVASVEKEPDWDFDITLLVENAKTGSLWLVSDSGCSCPIPFEDVRSFADMTPVHSEATIDKYNGYPYSVKSSELTEFKRKARAAFRKHKKSV